MVRVDIQHDPFICGQCGTVCGSLEGCRFGACGGSPPASFQCPVGQVDCLPQQCFLLDFDEADCGECGNICPYHLPICREGRCEQFIVLPPFLS
jgi:hypothetical protein